MHDGVPISGRSRCHITSRPGYAPLFSGVPCGYLLRASECASRLRVKRHTAIFRALTGLAAPPNLSGIIDASWKNAAEIDLGWDYMYRRPAEEMTKVYLAQYGGALYIAWDVHQREPLTINQNTNGAGVYNDDHVGIAFYPQGTQGFVYIFRSGPLGARDQYSSENSAYAPQWESHGRRTAYGYELTMRIPLGVYVRAAHGRGACSLPAKPSR